MNGLIKDVENCLFVKNISLVDGLFYLAGSCQKKVPQMPILLKKLEKQVSWKN